MQKEQAQVTFFLGGGASGRDAPGYLRIKQMGKQRLCLVQVFTVPWEVALRSLFKPFILQNLKPSERELLHISMSGAGLGLAPRSLDS